MERWMKFVGSHYSPYSGQAGVRDGKSIKSHLETKGYKIFDWKTAKKESIQKTSVNMGG